MSIQLSDEEPWRVALQEMQKCRLVPWQSPTELQDEAVWAFGRLEETYRHWRKERTVKDILKEKLQGCKLIVFDCDGTLGDPPGIDRTPGAKVPAQFRKTADDWQLFPGRKELLAELQSRDLRTAMITNQGGVGFGYLNESDMQMWLLNLSFELGTTGNFVCFNHPKASIEHYRKEDYDRKPWPGMLFKTMAFHFVIPQATLYVGDREEDAQAAHNCGCGFVWAHEFFGE